MANVAERAMRGLTGSASGPALEELLRRQGASRPASAGIAQGAAGSGGSSPVRSRLNFQPTSADVDPPPTAARSPGAAGLSQPQVAPRGPISATPRTDARPGMFTPRAESEAYDRMNREARRLDAYKSTAMEQAEVRAQELREDALQLEADADRAAAAGNPNLEEAYRKQANEMQKRADNEIERTRKSVETEVQSGKRRASRSYEELVENRRSRKAARRAKIGRGVRGGVIGLLTAGAGAAAAYGVDAYVKSQARAREEGATEGESKIADITRRAARGEELDSDEVKALRNAVSPEVFRGLMELGDAAKETGIDPTDSDELEDGIEAEAEENAALREQGVDPEAVDAQIDAEPEPDGEFGPFDTGESQQDTGAPFMSASASGFDPDVYQAMVESGAQDQADQYAYETIEAPVDLQFEDVRTDTLGAFGLDGMANRLNSGGDVVNPEGYLGRTNDFIQNRLNPFGEDGSIREFMDERRASGDQPQGIPLGGGTPEMIENATNLLFGMGDIGGMANAADDTARDLYKVGEFSGFNDRVRPVTDELYDTPDTGAPAPANAADAARRQDEYEQFSAGQPVQGSGTGASGMTFDDLLDAEEAGVLGYDSVFAAAQDMGIPIPGIDTAPEQPPLWQGGVGFDEPVSPPSSGYAGGPEFEGPSRAAPPPPGAAPARPDGPAPETPDERSEAGGFDPDQMDPSESEEVVQARDGYIAQDEVSNPRGQRDPDEPEGDVDADGLGAIPGGARTEYLPATNAAPRPPLESGGRAGDFNESRGKQGAGLAEDAEDAEEQLNWINRQMRDRLGMDEGQRQSASSALIQAGAAMANTPGNFLQGFTAGGAAGLQGFNESEDRQAAAEQMQFERQQLEADNQRQAAMDQLKAQLTQAKIAQLQANDPDGYERKINEMYQLADYLIATQGMSPQEAAAEAKEAVFGAEALIAGILRGSQ